MIVKLVKSTVSAGQIGAEHGVNAASWVFNGRESDATLRAFRAGLDDGDPEWLDLVPSPDLSGERADGYTPTDLMADTDASADEYDAVVSAYENAFTVAAHAEIERYIGRALSSD